MSSLLLTVFTRQIRLVASTGILLSLCSGVAFSQPPGGQGIPIPTPPGGGGQSVPAPTSTPAPASAIHQSPTIAFDFSPARRFTVFTGKQNDKGQDVEIPFHELKSVRDRTRVVFEVYNVNRLLYDVTISGERITYDFPMPDSLKKLTTSGQTSNNNAVGEGPVWDKVKQANRIIDTLVFVAQFPGVTANNLALTFPKITEASRKQFRASVIDAFHLNAVTFVPNGQDPTKPTEKPIDSTLDILNLRNNTDNLLSLASSLLDQADAVVKTNNIPDTSPEVAAARNARARLGALQDLAKRQSLSQSTELEKAIGAAARLYQAIVETGDAFKATGEVLAGEDAIKFSYKIKRNQANKDDNSLEEVEDSITIPVTGALRINYSSGVFASWLSDSDPKTAKRPKTEGDGTETIVIDNGSPGTTTLVGGLAHFYRKSDPRGFLFLPPCQPALSIGVGTSGDRVQYLLGASAIFGEDQRLILTVGGAYGTAKRLASDLKVGSTLPDDRTDITRTTHEFKFVVGLTFNFGSKPAVVKDAKSAKTDTNTPSNP